MNEEDLSHEAQQRLKELTPSSDSEENWFVAYLNMLKGLAEKEIPNLADVKIKNQGIEKLELSRKEHAVAVELKNFAIAMIGPDNSAAIAQLPQHSTLDDFLKRVMPNTENVVLRERFMQFLIAEAEIQVDEQIELPPKKRVSHAKRVKGMAKFAFNLYEEQGFDAPSNFYRGQEFRKWWMSKGARNPFVAGNAERTKQKNEKMDKMLSILPHSKRANETMSLDDWRKKSERLYNIPRSTFDKYRKALKPKYIENPKWRFRVNAVKQPEKK